MLRVIASSPVTLTVPFEDENGQTFVPTAVAWTLFDENEAVVTTGDDASPPNQSIDITIPGTDNTITGLRGARCLRVEFTTLTGTVTVDTHYIVTKSDTLALLENSFQTYGQSLVLRESFGGILDGWDIATARDRSSAMSHAFSKLARLVYRVAAQDPRNYASFEDDDLHSVPAWLLIDIKNIPLQQYQALPIEFRTALQRAQLAEADNLLGGDVVGARRRDGILSETTGESSMMFNSRPALDMPLCKNAMRELSGYIYRRIGLTRG